MRFSNEQLNKIINKISEGTGAYAIYMFGSSVTDHYRPDSDLDLAFVSDEKIDNICIFDLAQDIADIANCDVDLVDLKAANTVFQAQIVSKGKVIACTDTYRKNLLEIRILKEYARLNEERACIIEKIKERADDYGSGHFAKQDTDH